MALVNFINLKRPRRPEAERTFTDPSQILPDGSPLSFKLRIRPLDLLEKLTAEQDALDMEAEYAKAGGHLGIGGEPVPLTLAAARQASLLYLMQVAPDEERYSREQLFAMLATAPLAAAEVIALGNELDAHAYLLDEEAETSDEEGADPKKPSAAAPTPG